VGAPVSPWSQEGWVLLCPHRHDGCHMPTFTAGLLGSSPYGLPQAEQNPDHLPPLTLMLCSRPYWQPWAPLLSATLTPTPSCVPPCSLSQHFIHPFPPGPLSPSPNLPTLTLRHSSSFPQPPCLYSLPFQQPLAVGHQPPWFHVPFKPSQSWNVRGAFQRPVRSDKDTIFI